MVSPVHFVKAGSAPKIGHSDRVCPAAGLVRSEFRK